MNKLLVVWKSSNEIDIKNLILLYTLNAKRFGWFDHVELLIWGSSQSVAIKYKDNIEELLNNDINIYACKVCSDRLNVSEELSNIGVNVMYTGEYLSDKLIDDDYKVITL